LPNAGRLFRSIHNAAFLAPVCAGCHHLELPKAAGSKNGVIFEITPNSPAAMSENLIETTCLYA
jgi:hypothetical protein